MNSKQAKRLRRNTQKAIDEALNQGIRSSVDSDTHIRKRSYDRFLVPSQSFNATVTNSDGSTTVHKDHAIQIRLTVGSPRQVYRQVKHRVALRSKQPSALPGAKADVQANRGKKRSRILSSIQLRPKETTGAVEHAGAESVQPEHLHVSGV